MGNHHSLATRLRISKGVRESREDARRYYPTVKPIHVAPMPMEDLERAPIRRTVQQQRARLDLLRDKLRSLKPTATPEFRDGLQRTIADLEAKFAA